MVGINTKHDDQGNKIIIKGNRFDHSYGVGKNTLKFIKQKSKQAETAMQNTK